MSISEKIQLSATFFSQNSEKKESIVHLFKEGAFWIAYEQSAYGICKVKSYQPTKKFVKLVNRDIVSIGFPESALNHLKESGCLRSGTEYSNTHIDLLLENPLDENEFEEWKTNIKLTERKPKNGQNEGNSVCETAMYWNLVEKIKNFDLSNATPMKCMMFLHELKKNGAV